MNRTTNWLLVFIIIISTVPVSAARYALLVGQNAGEADEAQLRYVENDLHSIRSVLIDVCGFDKKDIVTLYNGSPQDLEASLDALGNRLTNAGTNNLVLLYYSGHADGKSLKMGSERYSLAELHKHFKTLPAEMRVGIFDACQSGSITRLKGGKLAEPFLFLSDEKTQGQVILSSSSSHESSQEFDRYRNSVFTFHLVNGLRGSADASADGTITLSEAYQYAYNHTVSATARSAAGIQHPGYQFSIQGEGEIVIADLKLKEAGILLGETVQGTLTIMSDQGSLVADLEKKSGTTTLIALIPGTYQIQCHNASGLLATTVTVNAKSVFALDATQLRSAASEEKPRSKGSAGPQTHVDVAIGLGYEYLKLASVTQSLQNYYDGFATLGLHPDLNLPRGHVSLTAGLEIWLKDCLQLAVTGSYFSLNQQWSGISSITESTTSSSYAYTLSTHQKLSAFTLATGPGFKFNAGYLRNISLHAALNIFFVNYSLSSTFADDLYDLSVSHTYTDNGFSIVPSFALAYRYPILKALDIGFMIRYRYQSSAHMLNHVSLSPSYVNNNASEPLYLSYGLGGYDGRITVSYRIGH